MRGLMIGLMNQRLMTRQWTAIPLAAFCVLLPVFAVVFALATPILAHHSLGGEFIMERTVTLKGKVIKVEWMNPHSYVYLDVQKDTGKISRWALEGSSPNVLVTKGWSKDTIKVGDVISVSGYPAKDGSSLVSAVNITLPDGSKVSLAVK